MFTTAQRTMAKLLKVFGFVTLTKNIPIDFHSLDFLVKWYNFKNPSIVLLPYFYTYLWTELVLVT